MWFPSSVALAHRSSRPRPGFFFRADLASGPARYFCGYGDVPIPDEISSEDAVWTSLGSILSLPELQAITNGVAQRLDFVLSGLTPQFQNLATAAADDVVNRRLDILTTVFDPDWQAIAPPRPIWRGVMDQVCGDTSELTIDGDGRATSATTTITLSAVTATARRRRTAMIRWTDAQQRAASARLNPTAATPDLFCNRVSMMRSRIRIWPRA